METTENHGLWARESEIQEEYGRVLRPLFTGRAPVGAGRELGHILLDHRVVESNVPGGSVTSSDPLRGLYEREARVFAAELLLPLAEVRRAWMEPPSVDQYGHEDMKGRMRRLARTFGVSVSAMQVRPKELRLL